MYQNQNLCRTPQSQHSCDTALYCTCCPLGRWISLQPRSIGQAPPASVLQVHLRRNQAVGERSDQRSCRYTSLGSAGLYILCLGTSSIQELRSWIWGTSIRFFEPRAIKVAERVWFHTLCLSSRAVSPLFVNISSFYFRTSVCRACKVFIQRYITLSSKAVPEVVNKRAI